MNRNSKIISLYEKMIYNNNSLLQSLKSEEVYLCTKCQDFKKSDEFSKNQKWCKTCMKTKVNNDFKICECGKKIYLRYYIVHLTSNYHKKRTENMNKENI